MIPIRIQQLTKRFGAVAALDRVDLTIRPGEMFFLLGPSGCGKTTLLRTLAGFHVPDEGSIWFGQEDVTRLEPHKRNTGMMFQSYALWPHMSVAQNVAFGLEERKVSRDEIRRRVGEALESVHMGGFGDRHPDELSGGQQQRVALARALVIRPRCLLLDEPLSNLDAKLRLGLRDEIRRVCKEFDLTTVYVTHDQKEALSVADRMAILDHGRVLQVGAPEEIYRRPNSIRVAGFIGETDLIPGRFAGLSGGHAIVTTDFGDFEGVLGNPAAPPSIGEQVRLCVRPECWTLQRRAEGRNLMRGRLVGSVYLGELAQQELVADGLTLKVLQLNPRAGDLQGGAEVCATAAPEDVVVLAE